MAPRKPGPIFWISTFTVGIFSPGTGKRRINKRMTEICQENKSLREVNSELTNDIRFLRRELRRAEGEIATFRVQDEMNAVLTRESAFTPADRPDGRGAATTAPMTPVN